MPARADRLSRRLCWLALPGMLCLLTAPPAFAQGSNTSNPLPAAATPAQVVTSQPQSVLPFTSTCAQQSDTFINVTEAAGLAAELAAQALPEGANQVAEGIALGTQIVAWSENVYVSTLPSCEEEFTGTVTVNAGGVNVTGASIFNSNVSVNADVYVSGQVEASQVHASQGISAHGGAIFLGDPNGTSFSDGINIGGGAISGAGFGGAQAVTGAISAIAIGNGASAFSVNNVAFGTNASAGAVGGGGQNATAIGANSSAAFTNSAAFGAGATANRVNQQMFGTSTNTYTMPGITSPASKAQQRGLLELPTTDAFGNLATDGGETFRAIARLRAGVAAALAVAPPDLAHGERFGMRLAWGGFDGANALGFSVKGVLAENTFSKHDRLALSGGAGFGFGSFMGYRESAVVGAHAGMQLTW